MPLRGAGGLKRLVPSSHERSETRHKIILHQDSLREIAFVPAEGIEMPLSDDFWKAYSLG